MFSWIEKIIGSKNDRAIQKMQPVVSQINAFEPQIKPLSLEAIQSRMSAIGEAIQKGEKTDQHLVEVFAMVREASNRLLGLRHFDVQLIGGIILHQGQIAEMKTGEGKTLVATLPAALNALTGKPVHVVTVNDYLAKRDHEQMKTLFEGLGLTAGVIYSDMPFEQRQNAYQNNIIYGANNEFGFDYLRKNMVLDVGECAMGNLGYAIIDEIDSILIDEARTPLVISGHSEDGSLLYQKINQLVKKMTASREEEDEKVDYLLDEKSKSATLTETGYESAQHLLRKAELLGADDQLHDPAHLNLIHHLEIAMRAQGHYFNNQHYIIRQGQVLIIDEFTGRAMAGRRWGEGLHQAIEAKEGLVISPESKTLASITYQNFFLLYEKISGMTGTAFTEAGEFRQIYGLDVLVVPTNQPMVRIDHPDRIYGTLKEKFDMLLDEVKIRHATGQPVLIGTASIEVSEKLSQKLTKAKLPHQVLNAKQHEKEAHIVAQAGCVGAITIATNMAGRGTDIVLGGNLNALIEQLGEEKTQGDIDRVTKQWEQVHQQVIEMEGLFILGTEHHESRRIDNQLRGRSGRQGDPGETRFYVSLEDELLRIFSSDRMRSILQGLGVSDNQSIEHPMINRSIANAQKRVESHHFGTRKNLWEFDNVANYQRQVFYKKRETILLTTAFDNIVFEAIEQWVGDVVHANEPQADDMWDWPVVGKLLTHQLGGAFSFGLGNLGETTQADEAISFFCEQAKKLYQTQLEQADDATTHLGVYRMIALQVSDMLWVEHLKHLDHLKQGIYLQSYAQKNPIQEYKHQSFTLLDQFEANWSATLARAILSSDIKGDQGFKPNNAPVEGEIENPPMDQKAIKDKVGRNDLCPCGSGKKYKQCHGAA